jgi:hypothetical protein
MEGPDEAPPLSVEEDSFVTVQDGDEAAPHTAANGEGRCDGLEHSASGSGDVSAEIQSRAPERPAEKRCESITERVPSHSDHLRATVPYSRP